MDGAVRSRRRMRFEFIPHHTIHEGEGVGMVWFGLELIREELHASGTVLMGVNSTSVIQHISYHCDAINQTRARKLFSTGSCK
jgi:hypothetical protein